MERRSKRGLEDKCYVCNSLQQDVESPIRFFINANKCGIFADGKTKHLFMSVSDHVSDMSILYTFTSFIYMVLVYCAYRDSKTPSQYISFQQGLCSLITSQAIKNLELLSIKIRLPLYTVLLCCYYSNSIALQPPLK